MVLNALSHFGNTTINDPIIRTAFGHVVMAIMLMLHNGWMDGAHRA